MKKPIENKKFIIVEADNTYNLATKVNILLGQGYKLSGGLSRFNERWFSGAVRKSIYTQALIKG